MSEMPLFHAAGCQQTTTLPAPRPFTLWAADSSAPGLDAVVSKDENYITVYEVTTGGGATACRFMHYQHKRARLTTPYGTCFPSRRD